MDNDNVKGIELKWARYINPNFSNGNDVHLVKELIFFKDGTPPEKRFRIIRDFKRPFYMTKPAYRNHKQFKETESINKVDVHFSTQTDLGNSIGRAVGVPGYRRNSVRDFRKNVYLYGLGIPSEAYLKDIYLDKYGLLTPYEVASLDIEADVDTKEIYINTVATDKKMHVGINKNLLLGIHNAKERILKMIPELLPDTTVYDGLEEVIIDIVDEKEAISNPIKSLHNWSPDFLSIWNARYDIPTINERLESFGIFPEDVWTDPDIKNQISFFNFKKGSDHTTSEGGVFKAKTPAQRFDVIQSASSFYIIDAMQVYYQLRISSGELPGGYGLDNVLQKNLKLKKLKIEDEKAEMLFGADWHRYMVKYHPLEYIVYNIWDVLSMVSLENKTKDLSVSVPLFSNIMPFSTFHRGPLRLSGTFYQYAKSKGRVLGNANPDHGKTPETRELLGRRGFTLTLKSHNRLGSVVQDERLTGSGNDYITNHSELDNGIRTVVADLDAVSAYPSATMAVNLSRDNIRKEFVDLVGFDREYSKFENMNLVMGGRSSVLRYMKNIFNAPNISYYLKTYNEMKQKDNYVI